MRENDYRSLQTTSCRNLQPSHDNKRSNAQTHCISIVKTDIKNVPSISIDILVGLAIASFIGLSLFILYCFKRRRKRGGDDGDEENRPLLGDHNKKMHFVRRTSTYYQWNKSPPPLILPATSPSKATATSSSAYSIRDSRQQRTHPSSRMCTEESLSSQNLSSIPIIQSPMDDENDLRQQRDWDKRRKALLKKYAKNDDEDEAISVNSNGNNNDSSNVS